ncbi:MAG: PAS domain S-box protein, partial [Rhodospirillaceae bacterium]|nr:PAS domain S-box protein [Rhodospirillaceae bacterium]
MPQSSPGLIRNFTVAYVTALLLIGALITGSTAMLAVATSEQIGDAAVLNISGKQRMLSQRIAQFAQRRIHATSTDAAQALNALAKKMLGHHEALIDGNPDLGIINASPPSAREFYFQEPHNLDARVRAYVADALALSNIEDGSSEEAAMYVESIQEEAEARLLNSLDAIANHYEFLATERTKTAQRTEIFIAAVLLVMLAAVGLILFRPLVRRSQSALGQIIDLAADVEAKEKRLSSILETLADGVVTIDDKGAILSVNDAAAEIFGYSEDEMMSNNFRFLLPKTERRGRNSFFGSYVRNGQVGPMQSGREIIGRKKNGMEFSMELSISSLEVEGKQIFTSVVRDINDRKNAEAVLKRQAWVMENITDAVILTDPQGTIIDCNPTAEELTGYGRFELLGTPVMDLMVAGSTQIRSDVREEATSATGSGGVWRDEFEIRRKDGAIRIFENTTTGMLDDRDRLIGRVSVNRDVTEQREIDRVKNEFISVVSHELRTPLTSIMGSLSLIKSGAVGELNGEASGMIDIAHSNSERLVRLINDILDL